ncbi:hypothetical protein [Pseudooceanicola sp. MF1-13]|uniref:hypothetical protein n=1 Tax=Pseudooceanicola sp. MF1-13 TaxID=3379095 RepID=UPI0038927C9F
MRYVDDAEKPLLVSVEAFKSAVHIMADDLVDDTHLTLFLKAAQEAVETAVHIPAAPGLYEFDIGFSGGSWRRYWFPCRPVTELAKIEVNDAAGAWVEQDMTDVRLIAPHNEPQLLLPDGWSGWSEDVDRMRITATCGGACPAQMGQAMILMVNDWLKAGIEAEERYETPIVAMGVHRLMRQVRYNRPCVTRFD